MALNDNRPDPEMDILETAADWVDRLDELTPAERHELDAWLAASVEHRQAFAEMRHLLTDSALLTAAGTAAAAPSRSVKRRTPAALPALIAAGLAVAVLAGAGVILTLPSRPVGIAPTKAPEPLILATAIGVRADHVLSDQSVVHLNADSRIDVRFDDSARIIRLHKGEAMFDVAHNLSRPFSVHAAGSVVTAVGTRFDVDLLGDAVEVRVFDGVVRVQHPGQPARLLEKGRWLLLASNKSPIGGNFDPQTFQSWRSDWLDARDMPLRHVLARLNRYSAQPLALSDTQAGDMKVTGRFRLDEPQASLAMIDALLNPPAEASPKASR